ncbi:MAG: dUTP diphosphatase [archaeon]
MVKLRIRRAHAKAMMPVYAHPGDAGMDLFSVENKILKPGERAIVNTGLHVEVPEGFELQLRPRSGLAIKKGITLVNTPGTVDSGYRGEIGLIMINHSKEDFEIKEGDRIAQAVLTRFESAELEEASELSDSSRGTGGYGSTGVSG